MIAEAITGNGDGALDYYLRINPSAREEISELHRCEPYVYAQMIAGRDAADPRRGQELVADRDRGLEHGRDQPVDPGHPARARRAADRAGPPPIVDRRSGRRRRFRGTTYDIDVRQDRGALPAPGSGDAAGDRPPRCRVLVDGRPIDGTLIPLAGARHARTCVVEVRLA